MSVLPCVSLSCMLLNAYNSLGGRRQPATALNSNMSHDVNMLPVQVVPALEDMIDGMISVDEFMNMTAFDFVVDSLAEVQLPGSITIPSSVSPVLPNTTVVSGNTPQAQSLQSTTSSGGSLRNSSGGLNGGAIAGIVIGCVVGAGLIAAVAALATKQYRSRYVRTERVW